MDNIQLYKDLSFEIISAIKDEESEKVSELFDKRQVVLDIEKDNEKFIKELLNDGILETDKEIKELLTKYLTQVKVEIRKHKQSVQVNNSYTNSFKENLNIFYKKV